MVRDICWGFWAIYLKGRIMWCRIIGSKVIHPNSTESEIKLCYPIPYPLPFDNLTSWDKWHNTRLQRTPSLPEYAFPIIHINMHAINHKHIDLEILLMKATLSGSVTWHKSCQMKGIRKFANQMVHYV